MTPDPADLVIVGEVELTHPHTYLIVLHTNLTIHKLLTDQKLSSVPRDRFLIKNKEEGNLNN